MSMNPVWMLLRELKGRKPMIEYLWQCDRETIWLTPLMAGPIGDEGALVPVLQDGVQPWRRCSAADEEFFKEEERLHSP